MSGVETINQTETSITVLWPTIARDTTYILEYENNGHVEERIPPADKSVTHTVSNLSAGTNYTFTLVTVFEDVKSTALSFHNATGESPAFHFYRSESEINGFTLLDALQPSCLNVDKVVNKPHHNLHVILYFVGFQL